MIRSYSHVTLLLACGLLGAIAAPRGSTFPERDAPKVSIVEPETVRDEIGRDAAVVSGMMRLRAKAKDKLHPRDRDHIKYMYLTRKRGHGRHREFYRWREAKPMMDESLDLDTRALPNDLHTLRAVASDKDIGNRLTPPTGTAEYGVAGKHEIRIYVDNGPTTPDVAFVGPSPDNGEYVSGLVPLRVLSADQEGVERLLIRAYRPDASVEVCRSVRGDHDLIFWDTVGPDNDTPNGRYVLTARAVDRDRLNRTWLYDGTVSDAVTTVIVNNGPSPPRVHFTEPTPMHGRLTGGRLSFRVWADDPEGVACVVFTLYDEGGEPLWQAFRERPPYILHWDSYWGDRAVPDGTYALVATAVDYDSLNATDRYSGTAADTAPLTLRISNTSGWARDDNVGG